MIEFDPACVSVCVLGLIQREDGSMEKELEELRRSRPKPPVGGDFTLSDSFYFTRRGIESIVDDEVHFMPLPTSTKFFPILDFIYSSFIHF